MMLQTSITALLAAAPFLGTAAAAPATGSDLHKRCLVNSQHIDTWTKDGLNRRQIAFSTEGGLIDDYCDWWAQPSEVSYTYFNPQCYFHEDHDTWVLDASFFKGPLGTQEFHSAMDEALEQWIKLSGCDTG